MVFVFVFPHFSKAALLMPSQQYIRKYRCVSIFFTCVPSLNHHPHRHDFAPFPRSIVFAPRCFTVASPPHLYHHTQKYMYIYIYMPN